VTDNLDTPTDSTPADSIRTGSTPSDPVPGSNGAGAAPTSTVVDDRPADPPKKKGINRAAVEWVVLIVAAIVIAIVIKTFLFQAFYIPSESMVPTLEVGDRVLVNKLSYDLHDVNRGDIIVFAAEPNVQWRTAGIDDLVKRIIAMPGETITECQTGKVCINDRVLNESYLPKGTTTTIDSTPPNCEPDSPPNGCTVPAGHYFVLGDNRGKSADARIHGPIKGSSIVGRVFVRIWPLDRLGFL
jgi:signal peptidase I